MIKALRASALTHHGARHKELSAWLLLDSGGDEPSLNVAIAKNQTVGICDLQEAARWFEEAQRPFCFFLKAEEHRDAIAALEGAGMEIVLSSHMMAMHLPVAHAAQKSTVDVAVVSSTQDIETFLHLSSDDYGQELAREFALKALASESMQMLLGFQERQAVACVLISRSDGQIGIFGVNVEARSRHRGIATQMITHVIEKAMNDSKTAIFVECDSEARSFYEHLGFVRQYAYVRIGCADPSTLNAVVDAGLKMEGDAGNLLRFMR